MKLSWFDQVFELVSASTLKLYEDSGRFLHQVIGNQTQALILLQETWRANVLHWVALLYRRFSSTAIEALEHIIYACLVYFLVCLGIFYTTRSNSPLWRWCKLINNVRFPRQHKLERVLLVTSHPDDECMFFGPLIYTLTHRSDCQVYVLCLSNGNYEKQAQLRREELWRSCEMLGVPAANIIMVNATNLPDDPNVEWKAPVVANLILHTVESLDIQAICTFDREGVSQHPNHSAVYFAAASLCLANLLPKDCKFYTLDSINILRKYISIFDLLCTCCISTYWCILGWDEAAQIRRAMREHKSQMKWFRWLYIYFSRYMFINSLREVNLSDIELEMQIDDNSF
ncbi:N-acetylglucosaminyl-phosphatidylinositol de-N-acetylase isoform X1 [Ceratitis capitata]|uniref:N-acetylglucosaminyl-phosphatidylinositol de-N-acetylase n=2 Tax=Ceratitis capitata TaxID=7213 RepID=W8BKP1_CERCA|nr:N-acetylglucosaminyl-phosphatidylinositol de-N-acetylase isoform X1 [Ceratitis capitata]